MARTEILISGFGGQGVIRIGQTLGLAGVLSGLHATMLKSHGTETRGGYVRAQVVLSDEEIDSPVTDNPDFFIAMSKAAYQRFYTTVPEHGVIVYDPAYVQPDPDYPAKSLAVAARDLSVENFGKELYANMIIYGKIIRLLDGKIDSETAKNALKQIIPRFIDENLRAFDLGFGK
ncbi:MAG: 2-oxoacid:acceptor oxidoreductase family protein [Oscillospiraceae bacterium]